MGNWTSTHTIEPDGALTFAVANDISRLTGGLDSSGYSSYLVLDHAGATLYDLRLNVSSNGYYEAFVINKTTGALTLPPGSMVNAGNNETGPGAFTFSANDKYMYEGDLTTNSTYKNMPKVAVGDVSLNMAPLGKLLAAFGDKGLQVFHFNGGEPITEDATLVKNVDFEQAYWDDDNHPFAVSQNTGKVYVFTVTPTKVSPAPGSPYSIPGAQNLTVHPPSPQESPDVSERSSEPW